ncbi:hypothetical protein EVAR_34704_1 [Eumeta japonica]|uniref:Uncharacterized protein n=1 Tax=Eumeta variegata TaxID=151549 RepID=A0A4C1XDG2_EUMVA|nr:hypothetical protein EVAR_34704_1 [Eumeta japonica]
MTLAILEKTEMAKDIFKNLSNVCELSGIYAEAPYRKYLTGRKEYNYTKEAGYEPSCCNYGQKYTANYSGCPRAPKPHLVKKIATRRTIPVSQLTDTTDKFRAKQDKVPLPARDTTRRECPKPTSVLRNAGTAASALGEDISTIMSILQVVKSAEIADLATKFRKAKYGVDRLRIILDNQDLINILENLNGREMETLATYFHFNIVTPLIPTYYPNNINYRPDILDNALMKGVALKLGCIEPSNDIDNAIDALTDHIGTVVESSSRTIPAKSDRRELPRDVIELIRDKNTALHRAGKYPTCKNRSHVRTLQCKVKARMKEFRNDDWSDLTSKILPSHKAY